MATKSIAWDSGGGYIRLTYTGSGSGTISVESDVNTLGTARSKVITVSTTQGGVVTKNLTVNQAACPFPVGDVKNFSYTGNVQSVLLPAGSYKLQCWGAQGGSNASASSYSITAKAGGKGGYSEGVLTLSTPTEVEIVVGGQGSSSAGGFNGGGSTTGSSSYNASSENGVSRMGGGGGSTDIRLKNGGVLSRFIVAGGGGGGAMCYKSETTTTETLVGTFNLQYSFASGNNKAYCINGNYMLDITTLGVEWGATYRVVLSNTSTAAKSEFVQRTSSNAFVALYQCDSNMIATIGTKQASGNWLRFVAYYASDSLTGLTATFYKRTTTTTTSNDSQVGYVGGGTSGGGYSNTYKGRQNAAGSGGAFGAGANQTKTNYRYCSGAGGGGWYGGGGNSKSNSSMSYCKYSGGGSGWVNTVASAGNRPSGYTGLELDSGTTYAGDTSFPSISGGNEIGHSGNGYARITRLS